MHRAALIGGLRIKLRQTLDHAEALVADIQAHPLHPSRCEMAQVVLPRGLVLLVVLRHAEHLAVDVLIEVNGNQNTVVALLAAPERFSQMPFRKK